jgi:hypothetical protein
MLGKSRVHIWSHAIFVPKGHPKSSTRFFKFAWSMNGSGIPPEKIDFRPWPVAPAEFLFDAV